MTIYRYELINHHITFVSAQETKVNETNYSLLSNPNKRISKNLIDHINPEDSSLYMTEYNFPKAQKLFSQYFRNQAEVYQHTADLLFKEAAQLMKMKEKS